MHPLNPNRELLKAQRCVRVSIVNQAWQISHVIRSLKRTLTNFNFPPTLRSESPSPYLEHEHITPLTARPLPIPTPQSLHYIYTFILTINAHRKGPNDGLSVVWALDVCSFIYIYLPPFFYRFRYVPSRIRSEGWAKEGDDGWQGLFIILLIIKELRKIKVI